MKPRQAEDLRLVEEDTLKVPLINLLQIVFFCYINQFARAGRLALYLKFVGGRSGDVNGDSHHQRRHPVHVHVPASCPRFTRTRRGCCTGWGRTRPRRSHSQCH